MNRQELFEWTRHYAFEASGVAKVEAMVAALDAGSPRNADAPGFEVAVNDMDGFRVLKLIHVGDNERSPGAGDGSGGVERARAMGAALGVLGGATAQRTSEALHAVRAELELHGLGEWFPTVGLELRVPDGSLIEASFYSHFEPVRGANAVASALSLEGPAFEPEDDWFAFGFDILAGQPPRAKVYRELDPTVWTPARLGLGSTLRPRTTLGLTRSLPGTTRLEKGMKAYAHFGNLRETRLHAGIVEPRLRTLFEQIRPKMRGLVIAFVACGPDQVDLYFEKDRSLVS